MNSSERVGKTRIFLVIFAILTALVWSPLGYGQYGQPSRIFGMPSWAVVALAAGVILFALEWFFLFNSKLALNDDELADVLAQVKPSGPAVVLEKE